MQDDNSSLFGDSDTPDPAGLTAPLLTSQISSQRTQSTITLSSPSQKLTNEFKECDYSLATSTEDKEVQTDETIHLSLEQYQQSVKKPATYVDFKRDLDKIINYFASIFNQRPIMDPSEFEIICKHIGAEKVVLPPL